ncbi:MAG: HlyD family secretion protein [Burkholderiales bacterium]
MTPLFRQEALTTQHQTWLGSIQLIRPLSLSLLATLAVLVAVGVVLFLGLGQYTRKAQVVGVLVPEKGVLRLFAPQTGTVLESPVTEGQVVKQGDVLFVLAVGRSTEQGDTQAAVQAGLNARQQSLQQATRQQVALMEAQKTGLERQQRDIQRELGQIDVEADLLRQRLVLAQAALERHQGLLTQNFISTAQVQAKAEEVLAVRAQQQALERQRAGKQREIGVLQAQLAALPLHTQAATGELERDLAQLTQEVAEVAARQRVVVRAPQDGVVSSITVQPGQVATPEAALASLVPEDSRLVAQLYAPSSAVGFVRPEQTVLLRYQAYPYQKFGHHPGEVVAVSRTPLQAADLAALALPESVRREPLYRITVALKEQSVQAYGQTQALAPGMQLDADVLLDRRRLIEWIFEPLLSVSQRLTGQV